MAIKQFSFNQYKTHFPHLILPGFFMRSPAYSRDGFLHTISYDEVARFAPDLTKEATKAFLEGLYGKPVDQIDKAILNNLFNVKYSGNKIDSFGSPVICIHNKKPVLLFGTEVKGQDKAFNLVPLTIKKGQFYVNDQALTLNKKETLDLEAPDPQNSPKITYPVFSFRFGDIVFEINVKTKQGLDYYEFEDLAKQAIDAKNVDLLSSCVAPLFGYTSQLNAIFTNQFNAKSFPDNGVVIPVTGYKFINSGKYPSVLLTIDCSKLPAIEAKAIQNDNGVSSKIDVPLNEINRLFCSSTHDAYSLIQQYEGATPKPNPKNPWYLHIYSMGRSSTEVPRHTLYESSYIPDDAKNVLSEQILPTYFLPSASQLDLLPDYSMTPL